jgi:DNA-binding LacI/PurR family transcriptional regulator
MATLKEVAALAGVSTATASLALNKGPVNELTRSKVLEAAKRLNYVPNKVGRMLTTGRSNVIEMVIMTVEGYPNILQRTSLFYYLMLGVSKIADENGFGVRFTTKSHDDADLVSYFSHIVGDRSVDGIIIIPQFARDYPFLSALQQAEYPHVLLRPARFAQGSNYVDMGDYEGGRLVADALMSVGARRIALINGPQAHLCAIERERGLTAALVESGGRIVTKQYSDYTVEGGFNAMRAVAQHGIPDAVFCANDYMAAGALNFLRQAGISVPDQVGIIGYDDVDMAIVLDPPLSTVDNRFFDLGQTLASEVISLIRGDMRNVGRLIEPRLKLRQSHLFDATAHSTGDVNHGWPRRKRGSVTNPDVT